MPEVDKMAFAGDASWPSSPTPPQPLWFAVLVALGLCVVVKSVVTFVTWLHRAFLRPGRDLARRYGAWAVVTGATDGIGRALALELARRGLHLILVGRNPEKLARVTKEIQATEPSCKVRSVVFDLAAGDALEMARGVARVAAAVEGRDVGLLVNNAGATYPCAAYFQEVEGRVWEPVVRVNIEAATRITRAVVPEMAARGRGAVVNVGSGSSVVVPAFPLYAVYAASKAYIDQFSRSLSVEYKQYGVDVQCQIPLYVATKMSPVKGDSPFIPSPEEYAKAAVRSIGYESRCVPYWRHSVQWFFASQVPDSALNQWRLQIGIRKRNEMMVILREKGSS
ncbi:very-long-chain 3-oxoacyl-CoA reductase-like protein At1g24470 [Phragmites australis]|uniref:very-long-chain 3-oxoacyl-CoA reductase-like protein At1g24470 n=1 Tax=Phragmites australis TaxID=29695 RepID=UPI002D76F4B5|nr:very-long-chain 3-oxoacyl-CoA reductase-like protein At1g24470 [Phragmites australis]